ncbi:MAG TPA: arsenate reductase (glutaredoxin) [Pelomicrobium sp.]|nr:arsenate reductase (glutaredoxin) [Pelomicrobium sp.]
MTKTPDFVIYHNPRCSKSRQTLELLREHQAEPLIIEYLKNPPTREELKAILAKLRLKPEAIVRKGEELYKTQFKGKRLSDDEWLDVLVKNPVLIERPIVVKGAKAALGRPPENVLDLF